LKKHLPDVLPIDGKKVQLYYLGIKKVCNKCFLVGHIKRECTENRGSWLDFVLKLVKSGKFANHMFGDWIDILEKKGLLREDKHPDPEDESGNTSDDSLLGDKKRITKKPKKTSTT